MRFVLFYLCGFSFCVWMICFPILVKRYYWLQGNVSYFNLEDCDLAVTSQRCWQVYRNVLERALNKEGIKKQGGPLCDLLVQSLLFYFSGLVDFYLCSSWEMYFFYHQTLQILPPEFMMYALDECLMYLNKLVILYLVACTDLWVSSKEPQRQVAVAIQCWWLCYDHNILRSHIHIDRTEKTPVISGRLGGLMVRTVAQNAKYLSSTPALGPNISHFH